jgi:hypothetical protein
MVSPPDQTIHRIPPCPRIRLMADSENDAKTAWRFLVEKHMNSLDSYKSRLGRVIKERIFTDLHTSSGIFAKAYLTGKRNLLQKVLRFGPV